MAFDTLIQGGEVVDGTGAAARKADVGIVDGKIAAIGDLAGSETAKTIDATGQVVTPGFVDLHTHLDAQIGWDPELTSSSYHGVTTALIGNCGVGFAPVSEENRAYMAKLMESVEDIAAEAILDGLPWDWTSYGGYLDSIQAMKPALNIVGLAGHSSIRFEAMGDKSMDEGVQADDRELAHIVKLVEESVAEGAVGFQPLASCRTRYPMAAARPVLGPTLGKREPFRKRLSGLVVRVPYSNRQTTSKPALTRKLKCLSRARI